MGPNSGVTNYPVIAANGTDVYVAWTQVVSGNGTIEFAYSNQSGTNFHSVALSSAGVNADIPYVASYNNNVYVIWHQITMSGNQSVWVDSSSNNGLSWQGPYQLDNNSEEAGSPQITAFGNYAYATWNGGGAWFAESNDSGATWTAPINLDANNTQYVLSPWVSASGPNVYVTWNDNSSYASYHSGDYNPYISVSNDYGLTWSQNRTNLFPHGTNDYQVQVAASGNASYVVFRDHSSRYSNDGAVFFMMSNDSGTTWTPYYSSTSGTLSNGSTGITGWANGIAVSGKTVGYAFMSGCSTGQFEPFPNSGNGDCNVYASYSNDSGTSFVQTKLTSDFLAGPIRQISTSNVAASGPYLYVVWQDNSTSNFQVYFSATDGQTVSNNTTTSSTTSSSSSSSASNSSTTQGTTTTILTSSSTSSSSTTTSLSTIASTSSQQSSSTLQTSTSNANNGSSNYELYVAIAAVVAVAVVASAILVYRRNRLQQ
jgi:hypothetical protein